MKRSFTVHHKRRRRPDPDYASGPDDPRRHGRVARVEAPGLAPEAADLVVFSPRGNGFDGLLGVVPVAHIVVNPPRESRKHDFLWRCLLPMTLTTYQPAETLPKAQGAIQHKVREWLEAAGVIASPAALKRLREQRGGR